MLDRKETFVASSVHGPMLLLFDLFFPSILFAFFAEPPFAAGIEW